MNENQIWNIYAGNRRLLAVTKLGMETIKAIEHNGNKLLDIPVSQIEILENSRLIGDVSGLMRSIKDDGLIHPITVIKKENYNEKDYTIVNLMENIAREDITPLELANICTKLQNDFLMNPKEIAVKIDMPINRLYSVMYVMKSIPDEYKKDISFIKGTMNSEGKMTVSTVRDILQDRNLSKRQKGQLLGYIKKNGTSSRTLTVIKRLMSKNAELSVEQAVELSNKTHTQQFTVNINKEKAEKLIEDHMLKGGFTGLIFKIVNGELAGVEGLVEK